MLRFCGMKARWGAGLGNCEAVSGFGFKVRFRGNRIWLGTNFQIQTKIEFISCNFIIIHNYGIESENKDPSSNCHLFLFSSEYTVTIGKNYWSEVFSEKYNGKLTSDSCDSFPSMLQLRFVPTDQIDSGSKKRREDKCRKLKSFPWKTSNFCDITSFFPHWIL